MACCAAELKTFCSDLGHAGARQEAWLSAMQEACAGHEGHSFDLRTLVRTAGDKAMPECAVDKRLYQDFVAAVQAVEAVDHSTQAVEVQGMVAGDGAVVEGRAGEDVLVDAMLAELSTREYLGTLEEGDGLEHRVAKDADKYKMDLRIRKRTTAITYGKDTFLVRCTHALCNLNCACMLPVLHVFLLPAGGGAVRPSSPHAATLLTMRFLPRPPGPECSPSCTSARRSCSCWRGACSLESRRISACGTTCAVRAETSSRR